MVRYPSIIAAKAPPITKSPSPLPWQYVYSPVKRANLLLHRHEEAKREETRDRCCRARLQSGGQGNLPEVADKRPAYQQDMQRSRQMVVKDMCPFAVTSLKLPRDGQDPRDQELDSAVQWLMRINCSSLHEPQFASTVDDDGSSREDILEHCTDCGCQSQIQTDDQPCGKASCLPTTFWSFFSSWRRKPSGRSEQA
ncbi:hypothetical protein BD289DRAFT_48892 [Coniella lustricola]|uniref:Uncharacterized protein n=1 Tax=Coniella lustricola TaxID=2025994 RepID=A0A2T3AIL3_9PEZI|nr:hypothetical protein BD289DRAFT_48892 [Coniella lustricola]